MKKHFTAFLILCFVCTLCFVVTQLTYQPVDSLFRPPRIEGENSDIQTAFENSIESEYLLKSPLTGEHRSSFIRKDIDGDSVDEVIVFYTRTDAVDAVRINILHKIGDTWESVHDIASTYSDVYQVNFADVDNDNSTELIVCWRNFENELQNTLDVYKISLDSENKNIINVLSENYSEFLICDVNSDEKTDIIIFEKVTKNGSSEITGKYFDFYLNNVEICGEFTVDPAISSIGSVAYDYEQEYHQLRVYVDGYKTDTGITTDIVCWSNNQKSFERIENGDSGSLATIATRNKNIYCTDINSDSIIEIPVEDVIPYSEVYSSDYDEVINQSVITWMQYDGFGFVELQYEIFNTEYDYSIKIPGDKLGEFSLKNDLDNGVITFYQLNRKEFYDEKKPKKKEDNRNNEERHEERYDEPVDYEFGNELFSVFVKDDQDYAIHELSGYRLLATENGLNFYCQIFEAGKNMGITRDTIKEMLSV